MNAINMFDPKRDYQFHKKEYTDAINNVLEQGNFINGRQVKELEQQLQEYTKTKYCIAVANGTEALQIALMALDIKAGDEVITVAHTWISTSEVISLLGAKPVFIDIDSDFNMNPDKIKESINDKTKAIIPVSLYGQMANFDEINKIANEYNLPVIEDGAQSFGAMQNGKKSCSVTTIGTTSFFPSKPLGCYGDGGSIFTNDEFLATKMRTIKNHGGLVRFKHTCIGLNSRLDTIQAAILLVKLKYFDESLKRRNKVAEYYTESLKNTLGIQLPRVNKDNYHVWAQYTILVDTKEIRDNLIKELEESGVNVGIFYPSPLHHQECFKYLETDASKLVNTEDFCDRIINLPCYAEITEKEQEYVCNTLKKYYQ
jgi:UDP-2-acetamido-2-deoxy-ribo-hexuluronate aminotransferase